MPHFKTDPKPRYRPKSYREPDTNLHAEHKSDGGCETHEQTFSQYSLAFQNIRETLGRLDPVIEETDQSINCRTNSAFDELINPTKTIGEEQFSLVQEQCQDSKYACQNSVQSHSDLQNVCWLTSNGSIQEVRIGLRKDVYPDSHPSHHSIAYQNGFRNIFSNRRFSMPESQMQDWYQTGDLSLHYGTGFYDPSISCISSRSIETQQQHHPNSQPLCPAGAGATTHIYPSNQEVVCLDSVIGVDLASSHPGKVFMQTHL